MRSGLVAIMQKELKRFFSDRRMVLTTVLLPGLLIYLIYSFMGSAMSSNLTVSSDYTPKIYAWNLTEPLAEVTEAAGLDFEPVSIERMDNIKQEIANKTADLLMVVSVNFDAELAYELGEEVPVAQGSAVGAGEVRAGAVPSISLYYNSTRVESSAVYAQTQAALSAYKEALRPVFTVNAGEEQYNLASEEDTAGFMFASLLPMFLMIFLYSGCLAVAPESIAGEKERGTIATLLVTPLKRWELALGKILSLCIPALLSGASSFVGVMLSLPNLYQLESGGSGAASLLDSSVYGISDYLMLLAVVLSTVVLFVGLISVISAFARTTKEANVMVMPLMMVVMLVAFSAMFQTSSETNFVLYLAPVYNSVQCMVSVFGFTAEPAAIALTVGVNLLVSALCVVVLSRMFESERIIFSK
ncbi:MAG: ABC transporter permease subunit [Coriobacteriales bacterium]|jgi:sodium transport system permease protein|nr:ABC transporter permease subunit [Coriobacteriales bacterium]